MTGKLDPRRIYREHAVWGATPIGLVILLYDSALEDLRHALDAMRRGDIPARAGAIQHALLVLQQLQGTLDFERGGAPARQFEQFYNLVRASLLEAQLRNSHQLMQQQLQFMSEVRDCWVRAEIVMRPETALPATPPTPPVSLETESGGPVNKWRA